MTPMDASDLFELCEDLAGQEVLQDLLTMSHPLNDGTSTRVYEGVFWRSVLWHTQSFEYSYPFESGYK